MKTFKILLAIFIVALFLRIAFIFLYRGVDLRQNRIFTEDAKIYNSLANNLYLGRGYAVDDGKLTARREPVYPLFLSLLYRILGVNYLRIRIAQCFLGALLSIVILFIGKELFGIRVGIISALIVTFYYPFIQLSGYLMPENLTTLVLSLFVFLTIKAIKSKSYPMFFLSGLIFGLTVLSRGSLLFFLLLIIIWFGFLYREGALKFLFVFILGFIIMYSPWVVRNYIVFKNFIPVTTRVGDVLYQGYNPLAKGGKSGWWPMYHDYIYPKEIEVMDEIERNKYLTQKAVQFIIKNPIRALILDFRKIINMWRPFYMPTSLISRIVMLFSYVPILILGILGMIKTWDIKKPYFLFHLLIIYYFVIHALLVSTIRYRWPVMPYIIILAGFTLNEFFKNLSQ